MLAKVLHRLSRDGLVKGQPGPGGGYRLARPAGSIRLREIVTLVEGARFGMNCLFGLPNCSDDVPCPLHDLWREIRGRTLAALDNQTIEDLARGFQNRTADTALSPAAHSPSSPDTHSRRPSEAAAPRSAGPKLG